MQSNKRLLIVAQTIDLDDPVLGFFHAWIGVLAQRVAHIEVIGLYVGRCALPDNVRVHSLGKEEGKRSWAVYALRLLKLVWVLRTHYDAVFVHMNQEYVLASGWLWKILRKPVYLWRNHYAGSWLTDIAARFCAKVFCTSEYSYTARYRKTVRMPVGVDTTQFSPDSSVQHTPRSILFLARMSPSKQPEVLIRALQELSSRNIAFSATLCGSPAKGDEAYYESLRKDVDTAGLSKYVTFLPAIAHADAVSLYRTHDVFVNCSPSGMFDKTLFEAAASGCITIAASQDWRDLAGERFWYAEKDSSMLACRLQEILESSAEYRVSYGAIVGSHSLTALSERLTAEMNLHD